MNIHNFIESAKKAWIELAGTKDSQFAANGLRAIRLVEQEYEKTDLWNQGLIIRNLKSQLATFQHDLSVERQAIIRAKKPNLDLQKQIDNLVKYKKSSITNYKKEKEEFGNQILNIISSGRNSANKLNEIAEIVRKFKS